MGNSQQQKIQETRPEEEIEQEDQDQEEEKQNFICEICIEPILSHQKFKNRDNMCKHPFCLSCIAKYIKVKIEDNKPKIECPGLECKNPLDPISCRTIISKSLFNKWCDLLCESAVLGLERSYCPYQDCSALVLNECKEKVKKTKCPDCKRYFCFQCKIAWHAGYWCSESGQLRNENDILVGELIEKKKWTRCFKCGISVDRTGGCGVIHCRCGVEFCHKCGNPVHLGSCQRPQQCTCIEAIAILLPLLLALVVGFICGKEVDSQNFSSYS